MKSLKTLLLMPAMLALNCAFAQTDSHLKLSTDFPTAGEKISITYDPTGTVVGGKNDIAASVYFLDNDKFPVTDVDLKATGKLLTGDFVVPSGTLAFFVKISSGADVENNNDKGYIYLIYKDKQPIEGAYAMNGQMFLPTIENYYAKIKSDASEGTRLFNKEFTLYPNGNKDYVYAYYTIVARLPDYKVPVEKKVADLEKSSNEEDLELAATLLRELKKQTSADSLGAIMRVKFPNGTLVKNELATAFYKEKEPAKKDSIYHVYVEKYPDNKTEKANNMDNFRLQLASAYLDIADTFNFRKYESQVINKFNLQGELNNVAYELAKKGEKMDEAQALSKESLDIVRDKLNNLQPEPFASLAQLKKNYAYIYDMDADTYAFILAKQSKFEEALKYEQPVVDHSKTIDPDIYGNYIQILVGLGQNDKAKDAAEAAVKAGQGSADIKAALKTLYIKTNGKDDGYEKYIASLESASKMKAREELAKTMIDQPAPLFNLKDLNGKSYSLSDLKGKVVIVDFWATWCGPCKASLPGMQMAVNKYKDDPNVIFLFVDTWENGDDFITGVKKFIADNKYVFNVLIDEKGSDGRQSKVVGSFGVEGIPTKFIIDKNGHIRFKYVGYSGTPEKLVDEVANMVEMAGNPEAALPPTQKTSLNK
ncbi:TlpA family protein disulfide reductase [Mucilaginibacter gotjawali]|uniref:Peroxiredoxin n=2 Tax=Mucilaginibacter gotjawali TaxID=1550579 RepID=A0A839S8H9_9SPHI|nr:TlpA disulfide reductase family protein [Mucilaginibacter gotjawali]MBB3053938.1 peroxiredoxin [Mucilaginibacter gotjawali]BAU54202.1 Thiol-disulfide oxidoreductase ResA [Mucilaginibacter gotjawali]